MDTHLNYEDCDATGNHNEPDEPKHEGSYEWNDKRDDWNNKDSDDWNDHDK
jgi:hypothetical protein